MSEKRERCYFRIRPSVAHAARVAAAQRDVYLYDLIERAIEREIDKTEPTRKRRARQPA